MNGVLLIEVYSRMPPAVINKKCKSSTMKQNFVNITLKIIFIFPNIKLH